ncbi:hypothetical protein RBG61_12910 [Paludicola sp. MB14-C6]|uniref:hypothetical protein n=1 Tax=Paludihabitans sp. MB14-C6 TaxID=3070656 RepID=UPI0027DC354B|nr:hypothetical protein [Paludicola sp. MB14-C6]WMJ22876.1 hypothetical protein RBG61_12910 [Paludicola sp. MB14-C6]
MDYLFDLPNKQFIFQCLDILDSNNLINDKTMNILTSDTLCHSKFYCQYPILQEVDKYDVVEKELSHDATGNRRYYPNKFIIKGRAYIVTNDWYYRNKSNRDNRTPFVKWMKDIIANN